MTLNKFNKIGITQGRLTNTKKNILQMIPSNWESEFEKLREIKIDYIEFFSEKKNDLSPIWRIDNRDKLKKILRNYNINQFYFCDNYILKKQQLDDDYIDYLFDLTKILTEFDNPFIIIPLETIYKSNSNIDEIVECIKEILKIICKFGVDISFEISDDYRNILYIDENLKNKNFKITFDTGNFYLLNKTNESILKNIDKIFYLVNHIHLKDRNNALENVVFNTGNINFNNFLKFLSENDYSGNLTLETHRGDQAIETAYNSSIYIRKFIN